MKLSATDLEIEVIISRIRKGNLDLQPDFQRGEVWGKEKKQKLIDSILREWHVPAIHVIENEKKSLLQVLDGQQRLAAIRDFAEGTLKINGFILPRDPELEKLDGMTYANLPGDWRFKFDTFPIRIFRITEFRPEEPGELFYRLNQPSNLTSAEQRNAYYGPARRLVKELVERMESRGIDKAFTGFTNSRMAYDDILARLCCALENNGLHIKLTASLLAERYRREQAFPDVVEGRCIEAIERLSAAKRFVTTEFRFNKATLFSWLWFIANEGEFGKPILKPDELGEFISFFEGTKGSGSSASIEAGIGGIPYNLTRIMMDLYRDRSTSRVADLSSVFARDNIIGVMYFAYFQGKIEPVMSSARGKLISSIFSRMTGKTMSIGELVESLSEGSPLEIL